MNDHISGDNDVDRTVPTPGTDMQRKPYQAPLLVRISVSTSTAGKSFKGGEATSTGPS